MSENHLEPFKINFILRNWSKAIDEDDYTLDPSNLSTNSKKLQNFREQSSNYSNQVRPWNYSDFLER